MGIEIDRERFSDEDYRRFARRLEESLDALGQMLARPGFGVGEPTIGAELELFLVDGRGRPLPENTAIRGLVDDPRLTLELDRFNLEINPSPSSLAGRPFSALERELRSVLEQVGRVAAGCGGRVAMIGILPSLRPDDLRRESLTDSPRYRALNHSMKRLRREPFRIEIRGTDPEPVRIVRDDLGLEGANTSFQVHLTRTRSPASARTASPHWRSCDSTRARCGAGTGRSTTRRSAGTCVSRCAPCPPARP